MEFYNVLSVEGFGIRRRRFREQVCFYYLEADAASLIFSLFLVINKSMNLLGNLGVPSLFFFGSFKLCISL